MICAVCTEEVVQGKTCQSCEESFCSEDCWYVHFFYGEHRVVEQGKPTQYIEDEVDRELENEPYTFRNDGTKRNKWILNVREK